MLLATFHTAHQFEIITANCELRMPIPNPPLFTGSDGIQRCCWCQGDEEYIRYHDQEWGRRVTCDRRLFEKICLEGFQAGLSWLTILRKRENFRRAFRDFDFVKVARFNQRSVERLMRDSGIVRHRGKIESVINNAHRALEMVEREGSLAEFLWDYEPPQPSDGKGCLSESPESRRLSKDLKRRGWSFVGPTTLYAFMQSVGMVNDHMDGCAYRDMSRNQDTVRRQ